MYPCALTDAELGRLLADDVPYGDLTTDILGIAGEPGTLSFAARGAMTVCGTEEAVRLLELAGASARVIAASGDQVGAGALLLQADGNAGSLHRGWKV
ncbi:MAG: ModD protein, partial [Rhodocyclaceae bacterium]